jgi:hypothetical protein
MEIPSARRPAIIAKLRCRRPKVVLKSGCGLRLGLRFRIGVLRTGEAEY